MGFLGGSVVKNPPAMQETQVRSLGWEDPLEKGMAPHSSVLACRIPRTEEPGGLCGVAESDTTEQLILYFSRDPHYMITSLPFFSENPRIISLSSLLVEMGNSLG